MNCPACQAPMVEENFGEVMVDVCKNGCKGIWFDWLELVKLDERNEGFGEALKEAIRSPRVNDQNRGQLKCPKCSLPMHIHKYRHSSLVNVDECYTCAGFFLDSGELGTIRETFISPQEEEAYVEDLLKSIPEYDNSLKDSQKERQRSEALMRLTRFIRPSYYLNIFGERDKQDV
jgi:uncharacterized protein